MRALIQLGHTQQCHRGKDREGQVYRFTYGTDSLGATGLGLPLSIAHL